MLILARKIHERIVIGDDIEVSIVDIKGDQVKLGIRAPKHVKVYRQEVYEAIQRENRMAAQRASDTLPALDGFLGSNASPGGDKQAPADKQQADKRRPENATDDSASDTRSDHTEPGAGR